MYTVRTEALMAQRRVLRGCEERLTPWSVMLEDDVWTRLHQANYRQRMEWQRVQSRAEWESFRDARIRALRESLGLFPSSRSSLDVNVIGTLSGEGFEIENVVFQSRPGLSVTANLYLPDPVRARMPGILLCHSHHNPKTQGELQDMGMNWARLGATVLVMDQIGHGERRQQPFGGREDYHSRVPLGMQLHLIGESLMGWMVWDLMCGVDLLLSRPGIDDKKVILIGSVAGGGDPAAVTAALDTRISCVIPFNFGGPQAGYPLPPDAEETFNDTGSPGLESTRCLRLSARDGFLPWVILGAIAPRYLIYAHEFYWDRGRDPDWARLQKIFGFYDAESHLDSVHGWGRVHLRPLEASHCNNVGPPHRRMIYPILERWFGMEVPEEEYTGRVSDEELMCLTDTAKTALQPKLIHRLAAEQAQKATKRARAERSRLSVSARRSRLRHDLAHLLGDVSPGSDPRIIWCNTADGDDGVRIERVLLGVERGIVVPITLLIPPSHCIDARASLGPTESGGTSLVVGIAQEGKDRFLDARQQEIAELLENGVAVCLPDLRGTGETLSCDQRGLRLTPNGGTVISPTELVLGQTMVGNRLHDLRSVLRYLRTREGGDKLRFGLWGEAFAPANSASFDDPPLVSEDQPHKAEPLGGLMALLGALYEERVEAVVVRGGLVSYASMLASAFFYVPYDVLVPGMLAVGDLCDVAAALAPRSLRLEGLVDGRNRIVGMSELRRWLEPTLEAYETCTDRLLVRTDLADDVTAWLSAALTDR